MGLFTSLLAGAAQAPASTVSHEIMLDGVLAVAREQAVDQPTWCFGSISGSSWTSGHLQSSTAESRFVCGCRLLHSNVGNSTAAWHDAGGYDIVADRSIPGP